MKNLRNNLSDVVQSKAIRGGSLETIVPELYSLNECIEINPWHDHQSVFDHTTATIAALEQYLYELSFSTKQHDIRFATYLSTHVYGISHADLILLALLFHDIAKPSQNHELHGALLTIKYASVFELPHGTVKTISQLVLLHGTIHNVVNAALVGDPEQIFTAFEGIVADLYIPLLLISRCDAQGSDLPTLFPEAWEKRFKTIDEAIWRFSLALQ